VCVCVPRTSVLWTTSALLTGSRAMEAASRASSACGTPSVSSSTHLTTRFRDSAPPEPLELLGQARPTRVHASQHTQLGHWRLQQVVLLGDTAGTFTFTTYRIRCTPPSTHTAPILSCLSSLLASLARGTYLVPHSVTILPHPCVLPPFPPPPPPPLFPSCSVCSWFP